MVRNRGLGRSSKVRNKGLVFFKPLYAILVKTSP